MSAPKAPDGPDFTEHRLDSTLAYDGGLLKVHRDRIRLPDGQEAWREYVRHPGAVMVLAFLDPETIVLERQYRYPKGAHFIELPAGKIEPTEPPLETAKRELAGECGYTAAEWWPIATLAPCRQTRYISCSMYFACAAGDTP